jgi:hypothetical protein
MALWTNVDNEAGKPKYLNSTDKAATLGINADETSTQKATHAGWVLSTTGTGGRSGRVFNETLVAMGSMTGDNDTVDPDPVITFTTQPMATSTTSPTPVTYTVNATATRGAQVSYQWQVSTDSEVTWTNMAGKTSNTLDVISTDAAYVDGNVFRAKATATGAVEVYSNTTTLEITE